MQSTARQTRENRTITVDFQNEATYRQLLGDGKTFVELVMAFIRLCTKSHSFIGFLGIKIGLSGLEKAFKMRLKRSY